MLKTKHYHRLTLIGNMPQAASGGFSFATLTNRHISTTLMLSENDNSFQKIIPLLIEAVLWREVRVGKCHQDCESMYEKFDSEPVTHHYYIFEKK